MRSSSNRLAADTAKGFSGTAIDRNQPVHFRLDGRLISGFAGDTVLSAALASGIDTLGQYRDSPIGLTPSASPSIRLAGAAADPGQALPMARTPALDGADFITIGAHRHNPLTRLFRPGRSLGLPLDQIALRPPWRTAPAAPGGSSDLVVVGGGVAGMSAALAAAKAGLRVILIEAGPQLGGNSGLFGTQDGENPPEVDMAQLRAAVEGSDAITLLTGTCAFALRPGLVRVHRLALIDGSPRGQVLDLETRFIVLATGARERLPIFAGNRLPGVIGTLDAHTLASRYGIWPGRNALVATASNFAYRLAMLASDAGIAIPRILDSRRQPSSRFIAFSRAYGMVQALGTMAEAVEIAKAGGALTVRTDQKNAEPLVTDRLVVCGGWQPDLTLWHVAGGASAWNGALHRLEARGALDQVVLAGAAAGYFTRRACIESGADMVKALLGRARNPVADLLIEPMHESPDAPCPIADPDNDAAPAFLDNGTELLQRPAARIRRWTDFFNRNTTENGLTALSEAPQPLAIGDVAAGVDLGLIPTEAAGSVAQERVALVTLPAGAVESDSDEPAPLPQEIPLYLQGRFINAQVVRIMPAETRALETGTLIYRNSEPAPPMQAVGVVLRPTGAAAMALVAGELVRQGQPVSIHERGRAIPAQIDIDIGEKA